MGTTSSKIADGLQRSLFSKNVESEKKVTRRSFLENGNESRPFTSSGQINIQNMKGNKNLLNLPSVSVVGSRDASAEGLTLTKQFTEILVKEDFVVVSGLAKGIDTEAHKTTLSLKGKTISVIGTPFHRIYPSENKKLADKIAQEGLLLTTAKPNETHGKHLFPRRNKLMARISKATLVIETGEASGVKHQCVECLRNNKTLIFSKLQIDKNHRWVTDFIKSGAQVVESHKELTEILKKL